jgi:hypothetical protein
VSLIEAVPGRYGERITRIIATDAMQFLKIAETKLELQVNKRTDTVVDSLIKEVIIPPALTQATFLDVPGSAEVGLSTYLTDGGAYKVFDAGILTLALAGDNWVNSGGYSDKAKDTYDVYRAIRDIISAERGKFFFDREGRAVFWNRHHLLKTATSAATFNDTMTDLQYTYASMERLKNDIVVTCHPRTISTSDQTVLWDLGDSVIRVDPGKNREIYVKYEDEGEQRVGARDVTVADVVSEPEGIVATITPNANGGSLRFTNNSTQAIFVTGCKVRGRKILDSGQMEATAMDGLSQAYYGRRTLRINLPSIDSLSQAEDIAEFEKQRRSTPVGEVQSLSVVSHAKLGGGQHAQQLARTLGDKITVTETQTGHTGAYFIVGEAHEITNAGTLWKSTWYLEAAPSKTYFTIGTSTLNGTHVLAY